MMNSFEKQYNELMLKQLVKDLSAEFGSRFHNPTMAEKVQKALFEETREEFYPVALEIIANECSIIVDYAKDLKELVAMLLDDEWAGLYKTEVDNLCKAMHLTF